MINITEGGEGTAGKWNDARREKFKGSGNTFYGKTHSKETRLKIANRDYGKQAGSGNPKSRRVSVNGVIFDTMASAAAHIGINPNTLRDRIKGRTAIPYPDYFYIE